MDLDRLLQEHFGFSQFRRGQREIITSVLAGRDTLAIMPTGGGKSLCFQLPSLCKKGITLIISPLIALMKDQVSALAAKSIPAGALHSNQEMSDKREIFARLRESSSFLLYLAPERAQKPGFLEWFKRAPVALVALDEAHCISQWGPDFREDYYKLSVLRELRPEVPILALTATATPNVIGDIHRRLHLKNAAQFVYGFYRPNLYYQIETCATDEEKMHFLREALHKFPHGRVIIYAGTRRRCEELSATLGREFEGVDFYHAGMKPAERSETQRRFEKGELRILIATIAFGMGIDLPDVRLVVHFQLPPNIESYYQEIGRAGRDGKEATCLMLYSKKDKSLRIFFIRQSRAEKNIIQQRWRALETMIDYAESAECRHGGILTYFRDQERLQACGHCDVCAPNSLRRVRLERPRLGEVYEPQRKRAGAVAKKKAPPTQIPLDAQEEILFHLLRDWRRKRAQQSDVPAFVIMSDKTLNDLVRKKPTTEAELLAVYGLGEKKIAAFGKELVEQLALGRGA